MSRRWIFPTIAVLAVTFAGCEESPAQPVDDAEASLQAAGPLALAFGPGARGLLALADELELTEGQRGAIRTVLEELRAANAPLLEQLRAEGPPRGRFRRGPGAADGATPSPAAEQLRANTRAAMEEIREILTAEQLQRAQELMAERRERQERGRAGFRGPGPRAGGGPGLLALAERLELTEDQIERLRTIQTEVREANAPLLEQLRAENGGERPFGRRGGSDHPLVQEIRANLEAAREASLAVLTEAQRARLDELRAEREGRRERPGRRPGVGRRPGG